MRAIKPFVASGDISDTFLERARSQTEVAWDIETGGLDWRSDQLATCQLAVADEIVLVRLGTDDQPRNLRLLLEDTTTRKVFHHAPFDLRFMTYQWGARPANIGCTKIAAKVTSPGLPHDAYSLQSTLRTNLGIELDKTERLSDWASQDLSPSQLVYAASDVAYLSELIAILEKRADDRGVGSQLSESFRYLPTRVQLDIRGAGDVFSY